MLASQIKTNVWIVGAGPVGMATALLLRQKYLLLVFMLIILPRKFGIESIVLEKDSDISPHPKAHLISSRSMEIMRELGIEKEVNDDMPAIETWTSYKYWRYVLDPQPYGILNHFYNGIQKELDGIKKYSLSPPVHYSQNKFWMLLKNKLLKDEMKIIDHESNKKISPLLFNHNYTDFETMPEDYGIRVKAVDMIKGETKQINCKYLIGCEGVRSKIRESIGGELVGTHDIANFINIHFRSKKLSDVIRQLNMHAMLYFVYNSKIATILVNHNVDKGEFVLQLPYFPPIQDVRDMDTEAQVKAILDWINPDRGSFNPFGTSNSNDRIVSNIDEIVNVGTWKMSAWASDIFGDYKRKVFIAGDSGHSIPPAGGYGMNSGIADSYNLVHKIAEDFYNNNNIWLKDYNSERKFMDGQIAKFALKNFQKGEKIVNQLNVDLKTFNNLTKTIHDYTPNFIPSVVTKGLFNFTIKVAQNVSLNSYFIDKK